MTQSFSDPGTAFKLEKSGTPPSVDGFAIPEYTGVVTCLKCGKSHLNIDEIPHDPGCPQRWVRSQWWAAHLTGRE